MDLFTIEDIFKKDCFFELFENELKDIQKKDIFKKDCFFELFENELKEI